MEGQHVRGLRRLLKGFAKFFLEYLGQRFVLFMQFDPVAVAESTSDRSGCPRIGGG